MGSFVAGVDFDTIAREWRCKWSADNDKESLAEAQKALNEILPILKAVDGVKKVDRIVCGGNLDFKVWLDCSEHLMILVSSFGQYIHSSSHTLHEH